MKKCFTSINLILILQLLVVFRSFASEILILKVVSEPEDNQVYSIYLELDSIGEIQNFKIKKGIKIEIYEFKKIMEGVGLLKMENREVLFMECPNCHLFQGGEIMIRFLKNGISHQYSEIYIDLLRKNEKWGLYKPEGLVPIKEIKLKANKLLGKVIGIKEIEINPR